MSPLSRCGCLVCVVAENPLAADYLCELLGKEPSIRTVLLADLLRLARTQKPSPVFLLDSTGLALPLSECLRRLRVRYPAARFILLGEDQSREELLELLSLGIHGYLPHGEVSQALVPAVQCVLEGGMWIPRDVLEIYVQDTTATMRSRSKGRQAMTERERQVMELVRQRLSNKQIAATLHIHERTVKFHLQNLFSKFQAHGRRELMDRCQMPSDWASLLWPSKGQ